MFSVDLPLRWSDLDAQGHVNNAHIVDYMQEARVAFFRSGPMAPLLDAGVVVVSHQVEYLSSVEYDDGDVRVDVAVVAVGGARFELSYGLAQGSRAVARSRSVLTPYDFHGRRPLRLGSPARDVLVAAMTTPEPLRPLVAPTLGGRGTVVPLSVRWSDQDAYGHVNNAKAYDYLQQARIEATTQWDPTMARAGAGGSRHLWLVARQDVDYTAQLSHRVAPYAVRIAPTALGTSSMTLAAEVFDPTDGTVFCRGRTVLVCADGDLRPVPLPGPLREQLSRRVVH